MAWKTWYPFKIPFLLFISNQNPPLIIHFFWLTSINNFEVHPPFTQHSHKYYLHITPTSLCNLLFHAQILSLSSLSLSLWLVFQSLSFHYNFSTSLNKTPTNVLLFLLFSSSHFSLFHLYLSLSLLLWNPIFNPSFSAPMIGVASS